MTTAADSEPETMEPQSVPLDQIPRGKYKSGRIWKSGRDRFTSLVKVKPLKKPLSKRVRERSERQEILRLTQSIKDEKRRKAEELRERRKINKERRLANERKAEIVEVIKDTRKLKRMSRKQLKYIETRDTSTVSSKAKT